MSRPRILFATSSFRTRWEVCSQALIRASGLADRVVLLDGRRDWHPLNFVDAALAFESDYIVHVDEDAFLFDPRQLARLIAEMEADPAVAAAAVPDGGTPYRCHNPYAGNLYFAVFKTAALRAAIARRPEWRSLRFDPASIRHLRNPPPLSGTFALDDFEPYYPLFWLLLAQGLQVRYLLSSLDPELRASAVYLESSTEPLVLHAWHLRKWFSRDVDPDMGMAPAEKYRRIGRMLAGRMAQDPVLLWHLAGSAWRLLRDRATGGGGTGAVHALRQKMGALLFDVPRFLRALCSGGWTRFGNRADRLEIAPDGRGVRCEWENTRELHLCNVFPFAGRRLLAAALREHPIRLAEAPDIAVCGEAAPDVSFLIGHRGAERLPLLRLVLKSIAAQRGVRFECIVAEQDVSPQVKTALPDWVRYAHRPVAPGTPFSRSQAFNAAAGLARGKLLVLHDNDLLVPANYAAEAARIAAQGYEGINHKRFIFYFPESATAAAIANERVEVPTSASGPMAVMENATGGGSLVIAREAFDAIGGMDEAFVGWGGEDVECWERVRTRKVWPYGYLPLIHLWHPAQPGKWPAKSTPGMERMRERAAIPPEERIRELRQARELRL